MSKFKVRRNTLATGGLQVGASGDNISNRLIFGSVSACVPAGVATSGLGAGSMSIPNAVTGMKLFFTGSLANGVSIYAASVDSAGVVTASYVGAAGATIASTLTFWYLGLK